MKAFFFKSQNQFPDSFILRANILPNRVGHTSAPYQCAVGNAVSNGAFGPAGSSHLAGAVTCIQKRHNSSRRCCGREMNRPLRVQETEDSLLAEAVGTLSTGGKEQGREPYLALRRGLYLMPKALLSRPRACWLTEGQSPDLSPLGFGCS